MTIINAENIRNQQILFSEAMRAAGSFLRAAEGNAVSRQFFIQGASYEITIRRTETDKTVDRSWTLSELVAALNSMVFADRNAISHLVETRVVCNGELRSHPTCQVTDCGDFGVVGMLGVINGMLGVDAEGRGPIAARFTENRLTGLIDFLITPRWQRVANDQTATTDNDQCK